MFAQTDPHIELIIFWYVVKPLVITYRFKMRIFSWYPYCYNVITAIVLFTVFMNERQIKWNSKFILYKEAKLKEP